MNYEELADNTADKLAALTNEQLEEILKPYFPQTRPELVRLNKPSMVRLKNEPVKQLDAVKQAALKKLAEQGIDLSDLFKRKKR